MDTRPTTVVYVATSLDGYLARSDGAIDWLGDSNDNAFTEEWTNFLGSIECILMGRKTFEQVCCFDGPWPYGDKKMVVLSSTLSAIPDLEKLSGLPISIAGDGLLPALADLNGQCSRIYVDGGAVIRGMLEEDLVDEMVLTTIPVIIGDGVRMFPPSTKNGDLKWKISRSILRDNMVFNWYCRLRD